MINKEFLIAIEFLVENGETIVCFSDNKSNYQYYRVSKFHESQFNTSSSIDFNLLEGLNITDFLEKNCLSVNMIKGELLAKFNYFVMNRKNIRVSFSKNNYWIKYEQC